MTWRQIVQSAGEEITAKEAAQLFERAQARKTDKDPYNASCPDDGQNPMYRDLTKQCFSCPKCGAMWDIHFQRIGAAQQGPLPNISF